MMIDNDTKEMLQKDPSLNRRGGHKNLGAYYHLISFNFQFSSTWLEDPHYDGHTIQYGCSLELESRIFESLFFKGGCARCLKSPLSDFCIVNAAADVLDR